MGRLTLVDDRGLMSVVHQLWQWSQVVLFGQGFVVDLDETDVQFVGFVVNVFQLLEGLDALLAFGLICGSRGSRGVLVTFTAGRISEGQCCCCSTERDFRWITLEAGVSVRSGMVIPIEKVLGQFSARDRGYGGR